MHDYPAFKDSFEKARTELEAAADSPNKSRPSGGQGVQSRKVPAALCRCTILHTSREWRNSFSCCQAFGIINAKQVPLVASAEAVEPKAHVSGFIGHALRDLEDVPRLGS